MGRDGINNSIDLSSTTFVNTHQEVVEITVDRLRLILQEYNENRSNWKSPLVAGSTIFITLITTDFKDVFIFSKEFLKLSFQIGLCICGFLFLRSLYLKCINNYSIERVINECKGNK